MLIPEYFKTLANYDSYNVTLRDVYRFAYRVSSQYRNEIENCSFCIAPFNLIRCTMNPLLRNWINWVNKNIILQLWCDEEQTTLVKLRIATGMLNKINEDERTICISPIEKIQIHSNLTNNVLKEIKNIQLDDLPF